MSRIRDERELKLRRNITIFLVLHVIMGSGAAMLAGMNALWAMCGLTLGQMTILQGIFALAVAVCELPTGHFADAIGRRISIVLSTVALTLGFTLYCLAETFAAFAVGELLLALHCALWSGALESAIYDTMLERGWERGYKRIFGRAKNHMLISAAVFSLLGGWLSHIGLRLPLALIALLSAAALPLAWQIVEPVRERHATSEGHLKVLADALRRCISDRVLLWLLMCSAFMGAMNQSAFWLWQPYFVLCGLGLGWIGAVYALFQLSAGASSRFAHRIEARLGPGRSIALAVVTVAVGYLAVGAVVVWGSFLFLLFNQFARGFGGVIFSDYINRSTTSAVRATTLSLASMLAGFVYGAMALGIGGLAEEIGIPAVFTIVGAVTLLGGTLLWARCPSEMKGKL